MTDAGPKRALFIMLNPSTADETKNDPTVRRCIGYARAWDYAFLTVCNIFALRSTDPKALYRHDDPVGPDNDMWIWQEADTADLVVCAWGTHGKLNGRDKQVTALLDGKTLHTLGVTKDGHPKHPLYVPANAELVRFPADAGR